MITSMAEDPVTRRLFGKAPARSERRLLPQVSGGEKDFWRRAIESERARVAAGLPSADDDLEDPPKSMN